MTASVTIPARETYFLRSGPSSHRALNDDRLPALTGTLPLTSQARATTTSGNFVLISPLLEETTTIPYNINDLCDAYTGELQHLSSALHPCKVDSSGRSSPLLSGTSLYPEMGCDIGPLMAMGNHGRMIGMSLHESELLGLARVASLFQCPLSELLGGYRGASKALRDAATLLTCPVVDVAEIKQRLKHGYREWLGTKRGELAKYLGTSDWKRLTRVHEWDRFLFVPSASGDTVALKSALALVHDERTQPDLNRPSPFPSATIDCLWLKGTLNYRYQGSFSKAESWLSIMDTHHIAPGGVVLIADSDRPLERFFQAAGYLRFDSGWEREELTPGELTISTAKIPAWSESYGIIGSDICLRFFPVGGFSIWIKPPPPLQAGRLYH